MRKFSETKGLILIGIEILKDQADIVLVFESLLLDIHCFLFYYTINDSFLQVLPPLIVWSGVKRILKFLLISLPQNLSLLNFLTVHPALIHFKALKIYCYWQVSMFLEFDLMRRILAMLVMALLKARKFAYV